MPPRSAVAGVALLLTACAHGPALTKATPAELPAPMSGRYTIWRDGEQVGEERFTITSSAGLFRLQGTLEMSGTLSSSQGYALDVDLHSFEPKRFSVWVELVSERESAEGKRDGDAIEVTTENIAGSGKRKLPYAKGTMIDLGTPISHAIALSLLLPRLERDRPSPVRTLRVPLPLLLPEIAVVEYTSYGEAGAQPGQRVTVRDPKSRTKPMGLWVRPDGIPLRARIFAESGGEPYEVVLEADGLGAVFSPYPVALPVPIRNLAPGR
jgi:hypothetical protein